MIDKYIYIGLHTIDKEGKPGLGFIVRRWSFEGIDIFDVLEAYRKRNNVKLAVVVSTIEITKEQYEKFIKDEENI